MAEREASAAPPLQILDYRSLVIIVMRVEIAPHPVLTFTNDQNLARPPHFEAVGGTFLEIERKAVFGEVIPQIKPDHAFYFVIHYRL